MAEDRSARDRSRGLFSPDRRSLFDDLPARAQSLFDSFRGVDPATGEADYAARGGLAGLLGMPAWNQQNPVDIAMGFAGPTYRAFHGSPATNLKSVHAAPASRQFDNATSQFGAFFAPGRGEAQRYAGKKGAVYTADVDLAKPYEMSARDFLRFQAPEKGPAGESVPASGWGARAEELKQEAQAFRAKLEAEGHDGIVVRRRDGSIMEIASFRDVPLKGEP